MSEQSAETFQQYRMLLFSIAYRMLGSVTDAEDIVQEAFVRWLQTREEEVESPKAYLSTVVVRLCIDQQRSAMAKREVYVGPWLPEPIVTGKQPELVETVMLAESLSYAFLIMLEKLGPLERAIFLLREVFEYEYGEIAEMVGKAEANCRQIFHRAQRHLGQERARFEVSYDEQERMTEQFMRASANGDMQGLLALLSEDIVFTGDGGGKAPVALKPIQGADKVARGTTGGLRLYSPDMQSRIEQVNGQPAIVGYVEDRPVGVMLLEVEGGWIRRIYAVVNPDKLGGLVG